MNLHITISGIAFEVRKMIRFTREEKNYDNSIFLHFFFRIPILRIKLTFEITLGNKVDSNIINVINVNEN